MDELADRLQEILGAEYAVERRLGAGGYAVVFLVRDLSLKRLLAVKVVRPAMFASQDVLQRFRREAETVAQLVHPNIVPLHFIGQKDDFIYLAMSFVDGGSLADQLARRGPFPVTEVRRAMADVASALAHAHRRGVIHRDIKSQNVLVDGESGRALLTDFGLARSGEGDRLTAPGAMVGTPAYLAPEQLLGEGGDHRADIFALGVMAYELLTGRLPFEARNTQGALLQRLSGEPVAPEQLRPDIPRQLSDVVVRCLARDPADRFQSAADVERLLLEETSRSGAGESPSISAGVTNAGTATAKRRMRRAALASIGVLAALSLVWMALSNARRSREDAGTATAVAVLPFDFGKDSTAEYLADGMTDELINSLSNVASLRVSPRSSAFALKGNRPFDLKTVSRELGVAFVVEGSVRRVSDRIKVSASLVDVKRNAVIASRSVERGSANVFQVEDEMAREIVDGLRTALGRSLQTTAFKRGTENLEAYDLFLRGRSFANRFTEPDLRRAIALYEQAIALDPRFSRPWAAIAVAWSDLADTWVAPRKAYPRAEQAARSALALDSLSADAHASLGQVLFLYYWDYVAAERELRRALELDSMSVDAHVGLALMFAARANADSALPHIRRMLSLDTLSANTYSVAEAAYEGLRRVDDEVDAVRRGGELRGESPSQVAIYVAIAYWIGGNRRQADSIVRSLCAQRLSCDDKDLWSLFIRGDTARLRRLLADERSLIVLGDTAGLRRYRLAHGYQSRDPDNIRYALYARFFAYLGDTVAAFRALDHAIEQRTANMTGLATRADWDPLRASARFKSYLQRVGLADVPPPQPFSVKPD